MRNIKLTIEYDGTNYHGWQVQPGLKTIQGIIQSKLSMITKADVILYGAGRTDAGVHALCQVANFKTDSRMTPAQFNLALNSVLPGDIVINHVQEVPDDFHARYSVRTRTYIYTILNHATPSVFLRNYTYMVNQQIDVDGMAEACNLLLGAHDFSSFASTGDSVKSYVRVVTDARMLVMEGAHAGAPLHPIFSGQHRLIHFEIEANGFLRCMVRAVAGTLLEIGKGRIPPAKMREIIDAKDRSAAGPSLPGRGLCLSKVDYS